MIRYTTATLALCMSVIALISCSRYSPSETAETAQKPAGATVPSMLFVSAAPAEAVPLIDAKSGAKPGDRVVFEARVGGRRAPFVENRAVFFVADSSLASCDQIHGDSCKTPWDYCCEPRDNLLKHMATVRVVDGSGQPLKLSLENEQGLAASKTVFVTGTIGEVDEAGNFVVDAEAIHVKGG